MCEHYYVWKSICVQNNIKQNLWNHMTTSNLGNAMWLAFERLDKDYDNIIEEACRPIFWINFDYFSDTRQID